jgi:hypothetical protein
LYQIVERNEEVNGAVLRASNQALLDATDRRTERREGM